MFTVKDCVGLFRKETKLEARQKRNPSGWRATLIGRDFNSRGQSRMERLILVVYCGVFSVIGFFLANYILFGTLETFMFN